MAIPPNILRMIPAVVAKRKQAEERAIEAEVVSQLETVSMAMPLRRLAVVFECVDCGHEFEAPIKHPCLKCDAPMANVAKKDVIYELDHTRLE